MAVGGIAGPFFFGALGYEVEKGCSGAACGLGIEHGEREGGMGIEAFGVDVVHLTA